MLYRGIPVVSWSCEAWERGNWRTGGSVVIGLLIFSLPLLQCLYSQSRGIRNFACSSWLSSTVHSFSFLSSFREVSRPSLWGTSSRISLGGSTSARLHTTRIMLIPATTFSRRSRELILPSEQEHPILGLNLLRLLVQNMLAEFRTEFLAHDHTCIKHADELRRLLYNRVLISRQAVPHRTYVYFMDLLAKAVRDEIAGCNEKAYDSLSLADAKKILMFASDQEWQAYVWTIISIWISVAPEYTSRELRSLHHARRFSHYSSSIKLQVILEELEGIVYNQIYCILILI